MNSDNEISSGIEEKKMLKMLLITCGIMSTLLYIGADIVAAKLYDGYSYTSQAISELSAIGAPSRSFLGVTGMVYLILVFAFGCGVHLIAGKKRKLRVVATLLIIYGVVGILWPLAPMHQREALEAGNGNIQDMIHLALGAIDMLLYLLIIGIGMTLFGRKFRAYSIITIIVFLVFGTIMSMDVSRVAQNVATPWLGVTERITVFSPMIWIMVLASALLQRQFKPDYETSIFKSENYE